MRWWRRAFGESGSRAPASGDLPLRLGVGDAEPRQAEPERYEVKSLSALATKYGQIPPDEVAGSESGRAYLDYGPAEILADSAAEPLRSGPEDTLWAEIDEDRA
jgi:hypothetical protein